MKIFEFNGKRNGSYICPITNSVGINTNGSWQNSEKGLAWRGKNLTTGIDFGQNVPNQPTDEVSVEAWINPSLLESHDFIASSTSSSGAADGYMLFCYAGEIHFSINSWAGNRARAVLTDTNRWYHVVGTFKRSTSDPNIKIYLDGVEGYENDYLDADITYPVGWNLIIGTLDTPASHAFTGDICRVQIYNHILTEKERAKLYSQFLNSHPIERSIS